MPKKILSPVDEFNALRDEWMETNDDTKLQAFCSSPAYRQLSYLERNRGFITGSKLETFRKDQWWYYLQFVEEMPPPYAVDTTYEPFAIGSAFDEFITYGEQAMLSQFIEVNPRVSDIDLALEECAASINKHQNNFNKDGSRSKVGIDGEEKAKLRLMFLESLKGKTQLTPANMELVRQMYNEWQGNELFDKKLLKKHIFFKLNGEIPIKCELDHHIPHFTNEDLGANDYFAVVDAKTCASTPDAIKFARDKYLGQMTLYAMAAELRLLKDAEVDQPVCAIIKAVDKHGLWSRSAGIYFSPELLKDGRGVLINNIEACWRAHKTGMFFKTDEFLPDCPYYAVDNYGRAKKFFIA